MNRVLMTEGITGRIYVIRSDSHPELLPYYGSTIQALYMRWSRHKSASNNTSSKELMRCPDVRIELVEELVCESIAILRKKEQWYIENNECCNKLSASKPTDHREIVSAKHREYYKANKETILAQFKVNRDANRETVLARHKAYREANRDAILAKKKAHYEANKEALSIQNKAYYEKNREARIAHQKAYIDANKEIIKAKKKEYYEANKDTILARLKHKNSSIDQKSAFKSKLISEDVLPTPDLA